MTCPSCAHRRAEIQRLDGELAKARAERDEMVETLGDAAEHQADVSKEADVARATVERLKAGLLEMRGVIVAAEAPYSLGRGWRDNLVDDIDALLKESP